MTKKNIWDSRKYASRNKKKKKMTSYGLISGELTKMFECNQELSSLNKSISAIKKEIELVKDANIYIDGIYDPLLMEWVILDAKYNHMYDHGFTLVSRIKSIQNFISTRRLSRLQLSQYYRNLDFFKIIYGNFKKLTTDLYKERKKEKDE